MGLPFTKNQVRKLGDRLRAAETPDDADLDKLHELLESYDESMSLAEHVLRDELGYAVSSRLKNAGTIVEKLRRNRNSHLGNIQDLAGVRMVMASNDRAEQDAVAEAIMDRFADVSQPPRRTDRRVNPIQGYRALHLVVFVGDLPVEVQIRTSLQQSWAEYFEKLGDFFGREIRYG
ncbi:MAG: RelA/SpoT domain-containing protein, partial [Pseudonocardia sp.]